MHTQRIADLPPHYQLNTVLLSHGWIQLPPFLLRQDHVSVVMDHARPLCVEIRQEGTSLLLTSTRKLDPTHIQTLRRMFAVDVNLDGFYQSSKRHSWIMQQGMGRILQSETAFEDLIKLILTTNCRWQNTLKMVHAMADALGPSYRGRKMFPSAKSIANVSETFLKNTCGLGYRAASVRAIACKVQEGILDLERLRVMQDTSYVLERLLALDGVGPYVAQNLLKFWGKPQGLGLDSYVRMFMKENKNLHNDKEIQKAYAPYAPYESLMIWCEVTRGWLKNPTQTFAKFQG